LSARHDQTLLRALAKAPADRFGSAGEMADAVAAWPVEAVRGAEGAGAAAETAAPPIAAAAAPQAADEERELWRTAEVRLALRRDARTARDVLIEEHARPLEDDALARLRGIAAAGGPFVQRVLRLSDDRCAIWYEAIAGDAVPLDALTAGERRALDAALGKLPAGAGRLVARTAAGPVVLVAPEPPASR